MERRSIRRHVLTLWSSFSPKTVQHTSRPPSMDPSESGSVVCITLPRPFLDGCASRIHRMQTKSPNNHTDNMSISECAAGTRIGGRPCYHAGVSGHLTQHHPYGSSLIPRKLQRIYQEIAAWLDKRSATKCQILAIAKRLASCSMQPK